MLAELLWADNLGFDANVTNVRFVMAGVLEPGAASTVGVSFIVRIIAE